MPYLINFLRAIMMWTCCFLYSSFCFGIESSFRRGDFQPMDCSGQEVAMLSDTNLCFCEHLLTLTWKLYQNDLQFRHSLVKISLRQKRKKNREERPSWCPCTHAVSWAGSSSSATVWQLNCSPLVKGGYLCCTTQRPVLIYFFIFQSKFFVFSGVTGMYAFVRKV